MTEENRKYYYSNLQKIGLINHVRLDIHPDYGKVIPLKELNNFFFGIEGSLDKISPLNLKSKKICYTDNGIFYIKLNKLSEYFKLVDFKTDFESEFEYFPYNYFCMFFEEKEIPVTYSKMINFINVFKNYLETLKLKESLDIINILGKTYSKGSISSYNEEMDILSVCFSTASNPLVINFVLSDKIYKNKNISENCVPLKTEYNTEELSKLYEYFKTEILLHDERTYIVQSLFRITGNLEFSEILYESNKNENEFIIDIDSLSHLILFKNTKNTKKYQDYFCSLYEESNIYKVIDEKILLNFNGLNKYLLNIDPKYLINFYAKDAINEIYVSITNEIIRCYRQLFEYNKLI